MGWYKDLKEVNDNKIETMIEEKTLGGEMVQSALLNELSRRTIVENKKSVDELKKSIDKFSNSSDRYSRVIVFLTIILLIIGLLQILLTIMAMNINSFYKATFVIASLGIVYLAIAEGYKNILKK
jgi:hypothetical protein